MKNLLIEGMPGCGKSTAIFTELQEAGLLPFCAGYRTQRIFASGCVLRGFAQIPASENDPEMNRVTDGAVDNLFLDFSALPPLRQEVLSGFTVGSLIPRTGTKLILIDEMGGRELEIPEVRAAYLGALKGELPVIGVLKSPDHARHFAFPAYESFRREVLEETGTELYAMTKQTRTEAREHIRAWLKQCQTYCKQ